MERRFRSKEDGPAVRMLAMVDSVPWKEEEEDTRAKPTPVGTFDPSV